MITEVAAIAVDGGELPIGGGLLALVRPALNALEPNGMLAVLSRSGSVREDLRFDEILVNPELGKSDFGR